MRRSDVDDLNGRARADRVVAGKVSGPELVLDQRPYQAGDSMIWLKNNRRLGIGNGTRATVQRVDPGRNTITIDVGGERVVLPAEYLSHGRDSFVTPRWICCSAGCLNITPWLYLAGDLGGRVRRRVPGLVDNAGVGQQAAVAARVQLLAATGPTLGRPSVDTIKGSRHLNMKELRCRSDGSLRSLFCFDPRRTAIPLLGGDKTGDWTGWYVEHIPRADDLYDLYLQELKDEGLIDDG